MKSKAFALGYGFFLIFILVNNFLSAAADANPALGAYADLIRNALASGQIDAFMKLIPKDLVIYDGSNFGVIRKKISEFMGDVIQADVTEVSPIESALHRVTVTVVLKPNRSFPIHFDVSGKSGRFKIVDIYDQSELESKAALKTLKSYASYENQSLPDFLGFTYMQSSDPDLTKLRTLYDLDGVAGNGGEIEQIIKLMQWVHKLVPHESSPQNYVIPQNSLNIIDVCQKRRRGVNCRQLATILNEVYLAMGFKSRMVTCLPADTNDTDCHVTDLVFSKTLKRWIYMDPSFEAYFTDKKGVILNHAEIRKAITDGIPVYVNDEINWNGNPYQGGKTGYVRYMTKNLVRFNCTFKSEFGTEDKSPFYVELYPKGYRSCEEANRKAVGEHFQCIGNPKVFWADPEN